MSVDLNTESDDGNVSDDNSDSLLWAIPIEERANYNDNENANGVPETNVVITNLDLPVGTTQDTFNQLMANFNAKQKELDQVKDNFRVPREHPVYDGLPENLEPFLVEMRLLHVTETGKYNEDKHLPLFISRLVPYFKAGSAVRIWFKTYASERLVNEKRLTWKKLVRDLRIKFGVIDQPGKIFESFWSMTQKDDVQSYIARQSELALLIPNLPEFLRLYGFIRGLKQRIHEYVKLRAPNTIEEAQKHAIRYEKSIANSVNEKKSIEKVLRPPNVSKSIMESTNKVNGKRQRDGEKVNLNADQKKNIKHIERNAI